MIRPATHADADAIIALVHEASTETEQQVLQIDDDRIKTNFFTLLKCGQFVNLKVVEVDGVVVGAMFGLVNEIWWSSKPQAIDLFTYIRKEHRGRCGVRLVKDFVTWAKAVPNIGQITLGTNYGGEAASRTEALYARLGFIRLGGNFKIEV